MNIAIPIAETQTEVPFSVQICQSGCCQAERQFKAQYDITEVLGDLFPSIAAARGGTFSYVC